jgi:hypothetical protein
VSKIFLIVVSNLYFNFVVDQIKLQEELTGNALIKTAESFAPLCSV